MYGLIMFCISLGACIVLGINQFILGFKSCWYKVILSIFNYLLYFWDAYSNLSLIIYVLIYPKFSLFFYIYFHTKFGGPNWKCSGLTPGLCSIKSFLMGSGDYMGCGDWAHFDCIQSKLSTDCTVSLPTTF